MSDQSVTPEDESTEVGDNYIDETVVDDVDGDDGLDRNFSEPEDLTDIDATGDHPGDVTNLRYAEELSSNRSVPSVELHPNPEDMHGYDRSGE